mgnify:FL=1
MIKTHDLKTLVINSVSFNYFFKKEKNDRCGNPRYRVWIIDPDGPAVYERIFVTYCLESTLANYIENYLEEDLKK